MDDSIKSRQENELAVLNSIYCGDIQDLRVGYKWKPLDLLISLGPQQGSSACSDVNVRVNLHIRCSSQYPDQIPQISFDKGKGVSDSLLEQLRRELLDIAKTKKGTEMIFELCQYVEEYLHKHDQPIYKSFHDEMMQRQEQEKMKNQEAKKMEEDRQNRKMQEEIDQIRSKLEELDHRSRKKSYSENSMKDAGSGEQISPFHNRRKSSSNESSEDIQCSHIPVDNYAFGNNGFREVIRGKCLKHSEGHSIYCAFDKETGENFIIKEWIIQAPKGEEVFSANKQLNGIEKELNHLRKLKHKNLALCYNFSSTFVEDSFIIRVLEEFIMGSSCKSLLVASSAHPDFKFIKHIANGVLQALDYLHRKSVIHRNIQSSCVYINHKGIVKVSNYSINQRATDLMRNNNTSIYNKKADIYKFGLFMLSLLKGSCVQEEDDITIPDSISSDLCDFLNKCLMKEEKDRYSASQLLTHQFFNEEVPIPCELEDEVANQDVEFNSDFPKEILFGPRNQSRIHTEFEFIEDIGKGAFGFVKKYKNKLDGRFYAIKRIQVNPKNKQFNKKIVREVQLLSRLNHENVVRYYNSWIETSDVEVEEEDSSDESASSMKADTDPVVKVKKENPEIQGVCPYLAESFRMSFDKTYDFQPIKMNSSSSDSDSSDEEYELKAWNGSKQSTSDGIVFENSKTSEEVIEETAKSPEEICCKTKQKIDHMYIQMEFCEKSTLKTAINDNLYKDELRVKRLFREILEGLAHIHQQGMIHRDLKPVNIFLDLKDHVKIGDFGLATTNLKSRANENVPESLRDEVIDESKTGQVGTPCYAAPELDGGVKSNYNEKVDIYSLGIILFEMCYKPPSTEMERYDFLLKIRKPEIIFPDDYETTLVGKYAFVIRWLLNHDASKRPTSLELLQSEHVPPPILEDKALMDLIRHTLNNPQSKGYKYLVASCFNQKFSAAQDITYDRDLSNTALSKPLEIYYEFVRQVTVEVFKKHGGQNLATPLLMPNSKNNKFYNTEDNCVRVMTHSGGVVSLPYDLRVSFARYIAWNHISLFRRYSLERVYREKKVFGFIPRELYECAFDIVTPTQGSLFSDAEILFIVFEIIDQLPVLKDKTISIHLNHSLLLRSILLYYGIKTSEHSKFISVFTDFKEGKISKNDLNSFLFDLGLSDNQAINLGSLLNSECELSKVQNYFSMITKKPHTEYGQYAKQALQELKTITSTAEKMGVNFEIFLTPGLVYNIQQFSGMICQFVCEFRKRKHNKIEVLAAGGRYDAMIAHYRNMQKGNFLPKNTLQTAVGISISLDKIVQAIQKGDMEGGDDIGHYDVLVCFMGTKQSMNEKIKILSTLSTSGLRWTFLEASNDKDVQEHKEELKIPHVIILKDGDEDKVILQSWDKERFQVKHFHLQDMMDELRKVIKKSPLTYTNQENALSKSESRSYVERQTSEFVSIVFHTTEKILSSAKKRYENQISSQLSDLFKRLVGSVVVLVLSIDNSAIKTLAAILDFQPETFEKSVSLVIEKIPKHKKILGRICDVIYEHKCKPNKPFLILYSLTDSEYKLIV